MENKSEINALNESPDIFLEVKTLWGYGVLEITDDNEGITRDEFHAILDRASQPISQEAESDSKKSET